MYLEPKTDESLAPSREKIKIVIDAGRSTSPVVNASAFVTCCKNTGMIKRKPANGICCIMELVLPNPNTRFFRRLISDKRL